jgi:hypothetical protein
MDSTSLGSTGLKNPFTVVNSFHKCLLLWVSPWVDECLEGEEIFLGGVCPDAAPAVYPNHRFR